jgi:hypothetical protein
LVFREFALSLLSTKLTIKEVYNNVNY